MIDLELTWGGDLEIAAFGDLTVASDSELTKQRLLRRLLTNPGDYIWQADYGAGLAHFIGEPTNEARIVGIVRRQVLNEPAIDTSHALEVKLHENQSSNSISLTIQFKDVSDDRPQSVDLLGKV